MASVCFVGEPGADPRESLLSFETARQALSTYELAQPYTNALQLETVSLGAAVALLDDLTWYLRRTVDDAIVLEPSIDPSEWLSRELATDIRAERIDPGETAELVKVYGVDEGTLIEPMYAERRRDGSIPAYDLREVDSTLVVRVSERAFGGLDTRS